MRTSCSASRSADRGRGLIESVTATDPYVPGASFRLGPEMTAGARRLERDALSSEEAQPIDSAGSGVGPRRSNPGLRLRAGSEPFMSPFVGRRDELTRLHRAVQEASLGRGSLWDVTGPAGIGKTRLLHQLGRLCTQERFEVRWGVSIWRGQTPLFPFLQWVRAPEWFWTPNSPQRTNLARRSPRGLRPPGARVRTDETALRILEALEETCRESPQLFVADDFDRTDDDSVRFLRLLAPWVRSRRIVAVLIHRGNLDSDSAWAPRATTLTSLLSELQSGGLVDRLALGELSEDQLVRLATAQLRRQVPRLRTRASSISELVRLAAGNGSLLQELLASVAKEGTAASRFLDELDRSPHESRAAVARVPLLVRHLVARRLSGLPEEERRILVAGAVFGEPFSAVEISAATHSPTIVTQSSLARIGALGWLIRPVDGPEGGFAFRHPCFRQSVLELARRTEVRQLADRLVCVWKERHPEDYEGLARLYANSSQPAEGVHAIDRLIEHAISARAFSSLDRLLNSKRLMVGTDGNANERFVAGFFDVLRRLRPHYATEFARLCERFLALDPSEPARSIVETWLIGSIGGNEATRAERTISDLRARLRARRSPLGREVAENLDLCEAALATTRGDTSAALPIARRLYRHIQRPGQAFDRLSVLHMIASCLVQRGRSTAARVWLARARNLSRRAGLDDTVAGLRLVGLEANMEFNAGEVARAAALATSLARRYVELGSYAHATRAWFNVGTSRGLLGDTVGARTAFAASLDLARQWGVLGFEGGCYAGLGECALAEGQSDEAERYYRRALSVLPDSGMRAWFEALARTGLARVHIGRGELEEADGHLRIAESFAAKTFAWMTPAVERARADWLIERGDVSGARRLLLQSLSRSKRGPVRVQRLETMASLSRLERRLDHPAAAGQLEAAIRSEGRRSGLDPSTIGFLAGRARGWGGEGAAGGSFAVGRASGRPAARAAREGTGLSSHILITLFRLGASAAEAGSGPIELHSVTQAALASEMGVPRASFSRGLLRLVDRGEVTQTRRRETGGSRSVKAYSLTPHGADLARLAAGPGFRLPGKPLLSPVTARTGAPRN